MNMDLTDKVEGVLKKYGLGIENGKFVDLPMDDTIVDIFKDLVKCMTPSEIAAMREEFPLSKLVTDPADPTAKVDTVEL